MDNYKVYMHVFPNGKIYVGITKQKPEYRWRSGKKYNNNKYMENAINKYGWDNIEHKILYENLSKEKAEKIEKHLIKQYKSNQRSFGYNILEGGNVSKGMSKEARLKMSDDRKGKHYSKRTEFKKGHIPWTAGKKMTKEFREKLSKGHLGQHSSPNTEFKPKTVMCVETQKIYLGVKKASEETSVSRSSISKACLGKQKTAGGYSWKYV